MKRILFILISVSMIISLFAVSASASSTFQDQYWYDATEFFGNAGTVNNTISISTTAQQTRTTNYWLRQSFHIYAYDIIIETDGEIIDFNINDEAAKLYEVSDGVYRAYLSIGTTTTSLKFVYTYQSASYITFSSIRIMLTGFRPVDSNGYLTLENDYIDSGYFQTDGDRVGRFLYTSNSDFNGDVTALQTLDVGLTCVEWYLYDYIEFTVELTVDEIFTINAYQGDIQYPVEVNYIASTDGSYQIAYDYSYDPVHQYYVFYPGSYSITVGLDVSDMRRSELSLYRPYIIISCGYYLEFLDEAPGSGTSRSIYLTTTTGYIKNTVMNGIMYFLSDIRNYVVYTYQLLQTNLSVDQEVQNDIDSVKDDINTSVDELETYEPPVMDDFDPESTIVDTGADVSGIAEFFFYIYDIPIIKSGMWISLSAAAIAFILF